jgi:tRNA (guanine-N7-)-methyltransferase
MVRSFVMRQGRITAAQRRAIAEYGDRWLLATQPVRLELDALFGRRAPRVLDIGSGMGEAVLELAERHPENDYLAIEVHPPGVGAILHGIAERTLDNLRVLQTDVVDALRDRLPPGSFDEAYLFFPDPWPKKRHHKRRLVNARFLALLRRVLTSHARLLLATDHEALARHMQETIDADTDFVNLAGAGHYAPRPAWRPATRFELRGKRSCAAIFDLLYAPAPAATGESDRAS